MLQPEDDLYVVECSCPSVTRDSNAENVCSLILLVDLKDFVETMLMISSDLMCLL